MRVAAVALLVRNSLAPLSQAASLQQAVLPLAGLVVACQLGLGLWTPVAGAVAALYEIWFAHEHPDELWLAGMFVAITLALAFLGPGSWSIDAMAYGRRRLSSRR